jgi:hypothetical protein
MFLAPTQELQICVYAEEQSSILENKICGEHFARRCEEYTVTPRWLARVHDLGM